MKPTLHVTNWSSRKLHGPGRRWSIMAKPRHWEQGDGLAVGLVPRVADLEAVQHGEIDLAEYRRRFLAKLEERQPWQPLEPGRLYAKRHVRDQTIIQDGDTLCCACSCEAADRGECHRALVRAGWRVLLDGRELESQEAGHA
jgi:hypothetical protein